MNRLTVVIGMVVILTLGVYGRHLPEEFAGWDFDAYHAVIYATDPLGMGRTLIADFAGRIVPGYYAPVSSISLMLDKYFTGATAPSPAVTASINLVIHCINGILLLMLLRVLGAGEAFCGIAVFLFLLHPIQVESVIWFAQRKTVLGAMFCLLSWISFLSFRRTGSRAAYAFSLVAFALGMLSKPTYVCLPALLLATEIFLPQDTPLSGNAGASDGKQAGLEKGRLSRMVRLAIRLAPYAALSLGCAAIAMATEPSASITLPLYERPFIAAAALWFYVGKLLVPLNLTVIYPRWHIDVFSWIWWAPLVALLVVGLMLWVFRHRLGRRTFWAMSIFLIPLGPAIGFFKFGHQMHSFVSNQFLYFSMIGAACLPALAADRYLPRLSVPLRYALVVAAVTYAVFLVVQTGNRAAVWNNTYTLWTNNSLHNPGFATGPVLIAAWELERGNLREAETYVKKALEIDPKNALAYTNLGLIRKKQGNNAQAEQFFRQALKENSRLTVAVNNLARVLDAEGRLPEAVDLYRAALSQKPDFPPVLINLGDALVRLNRIDEAIAVYTRLVTIGSGSAAVHNMLGVLYMMKGNGEQGIRQFREALRLDPGHREAGVNLDHAVREMSATKEGSGRSRPRSGTP